MPSPSPASPTDINRGNNLQDGIENLILWKWIGDGDAEADAVVTRIRGESQTRFWILIDD
jgi:hypothetical protein